MFLTLRESSRNVLGTKLRSQNLNLFAVIFLKYIYSKKKKNNNR